MSYDDSKIKLVKIDNYSKGSKSKSNSTKKKQHFDYLQNVVRKNNENILNGGNKKEFANFLNNAIEIQKLLSKKKIKVKNNDLKKTLMKMEKKATEEIIKKEKPVMKENEEKPVIKKSKEIQTSQKKNENNNINNTNFLGKIKELEVSKMKNKPIQKESQIPIKKEKEKPKPKLKVRPKNIGKKIKKKPEIKSIAKLKKISPKELREKFLKRNLSELKKDANSIKLSNSNATKNIKNKKIKQKKTKRVISSNLKSLAPKITKKSIKKRTIKEEKKNKENKKDKEDKTTKEPIVNKEQIEKKEVEEAIHKMVKSKNVDKTKEELIKILSENNIIKGNTKAPLNVLKDLYKIYEMTKDIDLKQK